MGKDLKGKELGSCLSQKKDGRYCARFTNRFGKRKEYRNSSLSEVKDWLNKEMYEDKMKMNIIDDGITLDEWYSKWMSIYKYNTIRPNTKRHYEQVYSKHISPVLGSLSLTSISQLQIRALIKELYTKGFQFETQNKVRVLLVDMFNKALNDEFVRKNPAKGIKLVRDKEKDVRVLSKEEQVTFFECCRGTFYDNLFVAAVTSGLRSGELCAITPNDLDFDKKLISVDKTLLYQKLEGDEKKCFHLGPPKTKTSTRQVPMNKQCELALKKQLMQKRIISARGVKEVPEEFSDLLFTTSFNTPINAEIYNDAIGKIVKEINKTRDQLDEFEVFSAHCFRHTFATRCFEAGIQPKTVQKYMGHATLQMTMNLYTHVLEKQQQEEMFKLENVLNFEESESDIEKKFSRFEEETLKFDNLIRLEIS